MTLISLSYHQKGYAFRRIFKLKNLLCHLHRRQYAPSDFCQCLHQHIVLDHVHQFDHLFHPIVCRLVPSLMMMIRYLFALIVEAELDLLFVSYKDLLLVIFFRQLVFCGLIYL